MSADNLKAIAHEELNYISAMDTDEIRTTLLDDVMPEAAVPDDYEQVLELAEFTPFDEDAFLYYRPVTQGNQRYVVTFDVHRFLDDKRHRHKKIESVEQWVT